MLHACNLQRYILSKRISEQAENRDIIARSVGCLARSSSSSSSSLRSRGRRTRTRLAGWLRQHTNTSQKQAAHPHNPKPLLPRRPSPVHHHHQHKALDRCSTPSCRARVLRSDPPAAPSSPPLVGTSAAHLSLPRSSSSSTISITGSMAAKPAETTPGSNSSSSSSSSSSMADVYKGELTPLQRHVAFFDRNKDGIIYPSETYQGFRAIGAGVPLSAFSSVFINGLLGPKTVPENEKAPAFKLPIYVKNIQKGKHGSDSGVYDANGRFVPEKFEEIFKKHAHTRPDALTGKELKELLKANREPNDFKGWLGGFTEWKVLYSLCKDEKGFLHKDTVRAVYDGSLFEKLEHERKSKKESTKKK